MIYVSNNSETQAVDELSYSFLIRSLSPMIFITSVVLLKRGTVITPSITRREIVRY